MWISDPFGKRLNYDTMEISSIKGRGLCVEESYQLGIFLLIVKVQKLSRKHKFKDISKNLKLQGIILFFRNTTEFGSVIINCKLYNLICPICKYTEPPALVVL